MSDDDIRVVPKDDDASVAPGMLEHLSHLEGFTLADYEADPRGWEVVLADGRKVGKVDDLVVDTTDLTVRYLEVKVDRHVIDADRDTWVLVPVGSARLDDADDEVVIDRLPEAGLAGAPQFARGKPTPEQERALREYYEPAVTQAAGKGRGGLFDLRRFFGRRRAGREQSPYIVRARRDSPAPDAEGVVAEEVIVGEVVVEPPPPGGARAGESGGPAGGRDAGRRGETGGRDAR